MKELRSREDLGALLPSDLWLKIFEDHVSPNDVYPFAMTCRFFRHLVARSRESKGTPNSVPLHTYLTKRLSDRGPSPSEEYLRWCCRGEEDRDQDPALVQRRKITVMRLAARVEAVRFARCDAVNERVEHIIRGGRILHSL